MTFEKLSIAFTAEHATMVRAAVRSGEYVTASEVIREALCDWQLRRRLEVERINEYRKLWNEGIASGFAGDGDVVMARLRKRVASIVAAARKTETRSKRKPRARKSSPTYP